MPSFGERDAKTIHRKLGADVKESHHVMGVVSLSETYRIRLYYSHGRGKDFPSFVAHKWRQALRLTPTEFQKLHKCSLDGNRALKLTRQRLGL